MRAYQTIFFVFGILWVNNLFTQPALPPPHFEHYTNSNGLSNNNTTCILQDKYGFIWVGTHNGLNRFDGYSFITYKNEIGNSASLSNNFIKAILEDSKGFIWVATNNGLNKFDPKTETFTQYRHQENNSNSIASNQVSSLFEDENGIIWIGAHQILDKLDPATNMFTHYILPRVSIADETLSIEGLIVYNNKLFVSVWGVGVYLFDRNNPSFTPVTIAHTILNPKNWVHDFVIDHNKNLLAADGVFLLYNPKLNEFKPVDVDSYELGYNSVNCITQLSANVYLVGTTGHGFYLYNKYVNTANILPDKDTSLFANNAVQKILVSNSGEIWFAMSSNGVYKWDRNRKHFSNYEQHVNNKNSLPSSSVAAINCSPSGQVWLGTQLNGITIFNPASQQFTMINTHNGGLNSPYIKYIFEDKQHNKWIGTWGGGINRIDAITGAYTYFKQGVNTSATILDNFVTDICQTPDNKIWIASTRGVSVLSPGTNNQYLIKSFEYKPGSKNCPAGLRTDVILSDYTGAIWVGTEANGISRYNAADSTFTNFDYDFNNPNSLGSNKVNTLYEDSKKRLWVGCSGGGLNLFVPSKKNFIHYGEKEGLPSNEIRGIIEDNAGILWITTDKGLSKFDTEKNTFKNYNKGDGLVSNQFLVQAVCKRAADGFIYAGTKNGLVVFNPDSIKNSDFVPPVYINSFTVYRNKEKQTFIETIKGIRFKDAITLDYSENTFTLTFLSLTYSNSEKNQYAYKLAGLNNNWITLGTTRELTFSNLRPGTYQLHVKASNSDLVWNEKGATLTIKILPPWWLTWWAYTLYGLATAGLVYWFIRQRIQNSINKIKVTEALRTKISSDLHDDVGTILSGLAMQSQMLTYSAKEEQKESLLEISDMSRDAMERMRDTVWAMDTRKDKYENLIDRMRDFAEKNLALKKMTHEFSISNIDAKRFINPEKRQTIYLIFKEAITNIIKHSDGKHVTIRFGYDKNKLMLIVHDNGCKKESSHSDGLGMSNMKMRAEKIGGSLTTTYDGGFTVQLII